jgi:hypothetical protein
MQRIVDITLHLNFTVSFLLDRLKFFCVKVFWVATLFGIVVGYQTFADSFRLKLLLA